MEARRVPLFWSPICANVRYLTGFTGSAGMLWWARVRESVG